jgi:hypothetical protein
MSSYVWRFCARPALLRQQPTLDIDEPAEGLLLLCRFDNISGTNQHGQPNDLVPEDILASIKRNGVCLKGTLFTPLDRSTSTQSLNVQVRLQKLPYTTTKQ